MNLRNIDWEKIRAEATARHFEVWGMDYARKQGWKNREEHNAGMADAVIEVVRKYLPSPESVPPQLRKMLCPNCGHPVKAINYASGPRLMHVADSDHPTKHGGMTWTRCRIESEGGAGDE